MARREGVGGVDGVVRRNTGSSCCFVAPGSGYSRPVRRVARCAYSTKDAWHQDAIRAADKSNALFKRWAALLQNIGEERELGFSNYVGEEGVFSEHAGRLLRSASDMEWLSDEDDKLRQSLARELLEEYPEYGLRARKGIVRRVSRFGEKAGWKSLGELRAARMKQPNVSWLEVSEGELLSFAPRYTAIDDVPDPTENGGNRLESVRQRSEEWYAARKGFVTASEVWKPLGFAETDAAKALDIKGNLVDHKHAVEYFRGLRKQQIAPVLDDPVSKVRMDWGRLHEARAKMRLLQRHRLIHITETGMHEVNPEFAEQIAGEPLPNLPPLAASPDAIMKFENESGVFTQDSILELKCRCPFVWSGDRWLMPETIGPHREVSAMHYAQLQIQMLCCELDSASLVSYSLRGMNLFEVSRDDKWLRLALKYLSRGNEQWVVGGDRDPEENFFTEDDEYLS